MKKVGILTFQFAHNYGAQLQAYALKHTLTDMGFETEVINYLPQGLSASYSINPFYFLRKRQWGKLLNIPRRWNQVLKFKKFQKELLNITEAIHETDLPKLSKYQALVVGSDQVWNEQIISDVAPYFFRGQDTNKFSYAASFGMETVSDKTKRYMKEELPQFKMVTVREKSAVHMIKSELPESEVYHVCDPVFLLGADAWRQLYKGKTSITPLEKYILHIDLRNSKELIAESKKLREQTGYKVYCIHPTCWKTTETSFEQLYNVGPLEYLQLVDHAEFIVTNSFHAVAFSCIFSKKVLHDAEKKLGGRVADLVDTLKAEQENGMIDFAQNQIQETKESYVAKTRDVLKKMGDIIEAGR